jgi:hypothetical protein
MKDTIVSYFSNLNYKILDSNNESIIFKHQKTGLVVNANFIDVIKEKLPESKFDPDSKYLFFIDESNLDSNVFSQFETYSDLLPSNVSLVIFSIEYLEHTMKDIWMFLNS